MKAQAVLFDLDGTLLDTLQDLVDSVNELLAQNGLPQKSFEEIRSYMGNGAAELVQCALPTRVPKAELQDYLRQYREIYARNMEKHTKPYPGLPELLKKLQEAGIKTGVISNKPDWAARKLSEKAFGSLLDGAVGDRPGKVKRKPDPEPLELMMRELGVDPQKTIYVGDSEVDIETARNAGIEGVAVSWGFRDRPFLEKQAPDHLVDTPEELWNLISGGADAHAEGNYMNSYYILAIRVDHRQTSAVQLQEMLTKYGCNIRLRVGMHEADAQYCADDGLIILQVCGNTEITNSMIADFDSLDGVTARMLDMN